MLIPHFPPWLRAIASGMLPGEVRIFSCILGGLGGLGTAATLGLPAWKVNSVEGTQSSMITFRAIEGLWMRCRSTQEGKWQCDHFETAMLGLPAHLSAYRAFMIIALVSTFVAFGMSVVGLKVVTLLEEESKTKRYVNLGAGFLHFVTGLVTGVAVSWYAGEVVHEYWSPYYQTTRVKYTLGACLYIGWIAMALSLAAGCLLTCCTYFNNPVDNTKYEDRTVSRIEVVPEVAETPMLWAAPIDHREEEDYYEKKSSKHSHHTKSHKSHHSHHHSSHHHSEKQSSWDSVTDDDHHDGNGYLHEDVRMDNFV